jgi:hypothetical protein
VIIVSLVLAAVLVVVGTRGAPGWTPVLALGILLAVGILIGTLTVEVAGGKLRCWFGLGLIRREISLSDVTKAEAVRNHWYYGWGIRYTPDGWLFNVSGLDAVRLTLASGKRFRIGTDEPQELVRAIRRGAAVPSSQAG